MKRLETWGDEIGDNMEKCLKDMKEAYDQLMSAINGSDKDEDNEEEE